MRSVQKGQFVECAESVVLWSVQKGKFAECAERVVCLDIE